MKLESIKSFTLTILVGISLLLTLGLWSYQPSNDIYNGQDTRTSPDIGGVELTKQELIEPGKIIFHIGKQHFGFGEPSNQHKLFKEIQSWALYDFQLVRGGEVGEVDNQVEIIFPDAIPMQITRELFTFNQGDNLVLPGWSFRRVIITFNQSESILKIHFISETGQQDAIATVNNSSKYDVLWGKMVKKKGLNELIKFDEGANPIYIPEQKVTMVKSKWSVSQIEPTKLVRTLFPDPNRVSWSDGIYSDTVRGMEVQENGSKIVYTNPLDPTEDRINAEELLDYSIENINDHKGWTSDNYRLVMIDPQENSVRYQMFYEGYPTYSDRNLTIIQQQWRNTDLYKYNRPLIKLQRELSNGEKEPLLSGSYVVNYLKSTYASTKDIGQIQDIKIGYEYNYDNTSSFITLDPAWFVKVNGEWRNFDELLLKKGGAQDAMESD